MRSFAGHIGESMPLVRPFSHALIAVLASAVASLMPVTVWAAAWDASSLDDFPSIGKAASDSSFPPLRLPELSPQRLIVDRPWSLWLRARGGRENAAIVFETRGAPSGLSNTLMADGWQRLHWTPTTIGTVDLELVARDAEQPSIEASRRLRLEVVSTRRTASADDVVSTIDVKGEAPTLPSLAHQVVSPGRTVRFRVRPRIGTGQRAIVQIDRLPRNASFDGNEDGSRTFHWMTGDRDQGEHRFRLTAIDAEDSTLRDSTEVIVTVGDPSRGKTVPAE